jgi:hypothetical protein
MLERRKAKATSVSKFSVSRSGDAARCRLKEAVYVPEAEL